MRSGLPFACFCIFSCSSILLSGSIKSPTSFDFSRCLDQDDQTISLPTVNAAATAGATSDGSLGLTCVSEACTLPICKLSHREFLPFGRASVVYTRFKDGLLGDPHGHDTHTASAAAGGEVGVARRATIDSRTFQKKIRKFRRTLGSEAND
jgi:hypothetical protein